MTWFHRCFVFSRWIEYSITPQKNTQTWPYCKPRHHLFQGPSFWVTSFGRASFAGLTETSVWNRGTRRERALAVSRGGENRVFLWEWKGTVPPQCHPPPPRKGRSFFWIITLPETKQFPPENRPSHNEVSSSNQPFSGANCKEGNHHHPLIFGIQKKPAAFPQKTLKRWAC